MSNPLYNDMNGNSIVHRFNQFKSSFKGDPKQQVQQLLNSGRISQAQYDQAVQKARMLQSLLGIK